MAQGKIPRQAKDKEDKKDTENLRGIIRNQKKQIQQLQRENARLQKQIDTRQEMRENYMDGLETPKIEDEFSGWRCQKCKHNKYGELTLPQGMSKIITYRTCEKCGHRERQEHEPESNRR